MGKVLPYYGFVEAHARESRDYFLRAVTAPHLYFTGLADLAQSNHFTTLNIKPGTAAPPSNVGEQGIVALEKTTVGNFGFMVTMGRAPNNDIVVPDQRVSKFHVYFRKLGSEWAVNDANSTNGTKVDGAVVPSERSRPLRSGSVIELGGVVRAVFLEPEDLYSLLQEARAWIA